MFIFLQGSIDYLYGLEIEDYKIRYKNPKFLADQPKKKKKRN